MIPLLQTVCVIVLLLCRLLSIYDVLQLYVLMSSLVYGCCGDAAVQYSWNTKLLVLSGHCILILCCFVFFFASKARGRKESCLHSAKVEQICCTCRTNWRFLGWKQVKKRWEDSDLYFRDLGWKEDGCSTTVHQVSREQSTVQEKHQSVI